MWVRTTLQGPGLTLCLGLLLLVVLVFLSSHVFAAQASMVHTAHATNIVHRSSPVHPLIHSTPCNNRANLFQVYTEGYPGEFCFANAGRIFVTIPGLNAVRSGANSGYFSINSHENINFTSYQTITFGSDSNALTYICIGHGC